jgi:hypothetical protein
MQIRRDDGNENGREAAQEELARHKNLRVQSRKEQCSSEKPCLFFSGELLLSLLSILSDRFDWSVATGESHNIRISSSSSIDVLDDDV